MVKIKIYIKLFVLSTSVLFLSCNNKNVKQNKIKITSFKEKPVVSDFFKSFDIIPLETKPECIINRITKIRYFNNHFYILDGAQSSFFIFNSHGNFIKKIEPIGRGPSEVMRLSDFSIDTFSNSIIVS